MKIQIMDHRKETKTQAILVYPIEWAEQTEETRFSYIVGCSSLCCKSSSLEITPEENQERTRAEHSLNPLNQFSVQFEKGRNSIQ